MKVLHSLNRQAAGKVGSSSLTTEVLLQMSWGDQVPGCMLNFWTRQAF